MWKIFNLVLISLILLALLTFLKVGGWLSILGGLIIVYITFCIVVIHVRKKVVAKTLLRISKKLRTPETVEYQRRVWKEAVEKWGKFWREKRKDREGR
ncbi:hypothetical protein DRP53_07020 [candidate division WOR-3 bacterium]|uniref:Uncharacterized protein n=1 Tax=candidate division WOR-3 bacterium TaxID=2052148 RepID=A0A660SG52_UNCW3|nr:MAG: hypothetical protein DRP53_07020 [candidate division WOR-3 bacterium]